VNKNENKKHAPCFCTHFFAASNTVYIAAITVTEAEQAKLKHLEVPSISKITPEV